MKALKGQLDSVATELKEVLELYVTAKGDVRRRFIREVAIALFVQSGGQKNVSSWEQARVLWDAKPEDC